jgi:MFS superfamily sulfate permease-like transporter
MIERKDILSSFVVFIVALPLSLGIALASGGSLAGGIISAIIGGVIVGLLSGAPLTVSGPAAGLSALVFQMVQQHGMEGLAVITVMAGIIQILWGALGFGRAVTFIPKPVLEGTLSAIGLIIVLGQIHVLMGQPVPKSPVESLSSLNRALGSATGDTHWWIAPVLVCGLLAMIVELAWKKFATRRFGMVPGALPAVLVATLASLSFYMPRVELSPFIPTMTESIRNLSEMAWLSDWPTLALAALGMAFVASAESLLTARAISTYSPIAAEVPLSLNRELVAQGVGNTLAGAAGGIPLTAVMVRSAANVDAGARTRWSTVLHGVWIALFVVALPSLLEKIPLTALASVLIITGFKLVQFPRLLHALRTDRHEASLWVFTMLAIMATDLLKGLLAGLALAAAWTFVHRLLSRGTLKAHEPKLSSQVSKASSYKDVS